ncbi:MAG: tetratricopeptide repeat protein [Bacteroidales bacterium]|nr:tetratricopeptide repeat protein [Bacteroidales bacterium]
MKHALSIFFFLISINLSVFAQGDAKMLASLGNDLVNLMDYEGALEKYNEALDYLPTYAPAIDGKANLLVLMEDYKAAGKLIEEAIKKNSDYPHFYLTYGIVLIHKGKHKDAIENLTRALDLAYDSKDSFFKSKIYVNRGAAYQKLFNFDAALNDYSEAIKTNKNNPNVYMYRGYLYYQNNEYELALSDFNTVIDIDPENPFAYYNRGMIYLKQADDDRACEDFHKSCKLGNNNACKVVMNKCIEL